jgi:hypothetical protein
MAQDCREDLAREMRAVIVADVSLALRDVPKPHSAAQIWDAVRASAETLGATFQVQVERDLSRPEHFNVTLILFEE